MYIKTINIKNFKSFKDVTIHFNKDLNMLTGINNSGKTTVLEALSLWNECFLKLIYKAARGVKEKYNSGDYILGPSSNKYFNFDDINSVRSPNFEDVFRQRNKKNKIKLTAELEKDGVKLKIPFIIGDSGGKYVIEIENFTSFNFSIFNRFFENLPDTIDSYYASPVASIEQEENFYTEPQIREFINKRNSSLVIRNRIYKLYQSSIFQSFQSDLSYILYNQTTSKLKISNKSDIQKDSRVIINVSIGKDDVEKDIALLGSGTLQAIEILLNVYQQSDLKKDLNIVLLDEPDSHIHRDIQKRLIEVLLKFSKNNQIFITTHNESLIRSTPLINLFHLDGSNEGHIFNMYKKDLEKIRIPHFKGMYPDPLSPIIKSIGNDNGLDFVNAIESDVIIFVEGDDDARVIYKLLQEFTNNHNRKIMFWVLGGVSKIFDKINSYKDFFSDIKNGKSLWDKSFLIFDKDALTDEHKQIISINLKDKLLINNYCISAYTQESIVFTDFEVLSNILKKWMLVYKEVDNIDSKEIKTHLLASYNDIKIILKERYSTDKIDSNYQGYRGSYVEKTKKMFNSKSTIISNDSVTLVRELEHYYNSTIDKGLFYKLMTKEDVEFVLNKVLLNYDIVFNIEDEFYDLIQVVDKSMWFSEWDFLKDI